MFAAITFPSAIRDPQQAGDPPASAIHIAYSYSPRVEQVAADTVVLDLAGLEHLFGSPGDVAASIARRAAPANVAVAANPAAAAHAARGFAGITVVPPGEEARVLGGLPLHLLSPSLEIEETFRLWGLHCFGDLAALPETGVAERLGSEGVRLQKLARGAADRPLFPAIPAPDFEQSMELEYPVTLLESLSFLLASLINQLCAGLEAQALAARELRLRLKLQDPAENTPVEFERVLRLPFPMRDGRAFLKLLQLDLESHPPPAPIVAVWLRVEAVKPRVTQHGLFLPLAPEPEKLELTLARIANLVGEGNVGSPELIDTHRPDAFRIADFRMRNAEAGRYRPGSGVRNNQRYRLGFRVFRPALRAEVQASSGRPARVMTRGIQGRVVSLAGPWRACGDWWAPTAWAREEWDVALEPGALYRLYRDLGSGAWFVDGCYD